MPVQAWQQFNCYNILRIPSSADPKLIRDAYRQQCKEVHPDVGGSHDEQVRVNLAFEVLSDPIQRQAHDRYWATDEDITRAEGVRQQSSHHAAEGRSTHQGRPSGAQSKTTQQQARAPFDFLYRRVYEGIEKERRKVDATRPSKIAETFALYAAKFAEERKNRNASLAFSIGITMMALIASQLECYIVWIIAFFAWTSFLKSAQGVTIGSLHVRFDEQNWREKLYNAAARDADRACQNEIEALRRHLKHVGTLAELLSRASTFDDSEEQVARRISSAFFLMGYRPVRFDREARVLVFTDGEERLLVRFRHRSGIATNIAYVKRMLDAMAYSGAQKSYLFCTPGLSGTGASLARQNGIKWYSLETMNKWIVETCRSEYAGPSGDILCHLDEFIAFLGNISIPLPYTTRKRYR